MPHFCWESRLPRPLVPSGFESQPMWDTFEATFFLVAGLSIGVVFGFLFPSLWRTFRRRFRSVKRYAPLDEKLLPHLQIDMERLTTPEAETDLPAELNAESSTILATLFVLARNAFQNLKPRDAVQYYVQILGHEQVSKQHTNRALFELSQVYLQLGLTSRAFDTAIELLHRKPRNEHVFSYLINMCIDKSMLDRLKLILSLYKGNLSNHLRLNIAHALCILGDKYLSQSKFKDALQCARDAVRWHMDSARARILLWHVTSIQVWQPEDGDARLLWTAFTIDAEARHNIFKDCQVSPAAGADNLTRQIAHLSVTPAIMECFRDMLPELKRVFDAQGQISPHLPCLEDILFMGALPLISQNLESSDATLKSLLKLMCPSLSAPFFQPSEKNSSPEWRQWVLNSWQWHKCNRCQTRVEKFLWQCPKCNSRETFESCAPAQTPSSSSTRTQFSE